MSLEDYKKKRNFKKTNEPFNNNGAGNDGTKGKIVNGSYNKHFDKPLFVIQKHYASRLHFDFRLEIDGVLKSWAMPKGPTINPSEKKLAVMVEDHPVEYINFEGTIPEGNYGAGLVFIWDTGTYYAPGAKTKKENDSILKEGLNKGHLVLIMEGSLLKGEFALIKLKKMPDKNWLFIKKNDGFALEADITGVLAPKEAKT